MDPVRNAKSIGYTIFIISLIDLLFTLGTANEYTTTAVILSLIGPVIGLFVGYGLTSLRRWAVYGMGILTLYKLLIIFYNYAYDAAPSGGSLFMFALHVILFFWFYSAKTKFKK